MYYFYLGLQCERYDKWSNVFLNQAYLKRFINLIIKQNYTLTGLDKRVERFLQM